MECNQLALARSRFYTLLGQLYLGGLTQDLLSYMQAVPELTAVLPEPFNADDAAADHHHLFGFNVFPYESLFLGADGLLGGPIAESVRQAYQEAGFALTMTGESPDHIGQELHFLAFLSGAESAAWENEQTAVVHQMNQRQQYFLEAHLLRWLPPLVMAIGRQGQPFYTTLADLTLAFVAAHYAAQSEIVREGPPLFALPEAPPLLDNHKTGLKEIAHYLLMPAYSGVYLSRDDVGRLARRQQLPRGFGERQQMLLNLLRAAVTYNSLPALLASIQALLAGWQAGYAEMGQQPELVSFVEVWQARTAVAGQLVNEMGRKMATNPRP